MPVKPRETNVIEREVRIEASPETVFRFFTDPERIVRWMGAVAILDPRPGGVFSLNMMGDYFMEGDYVEVEPYRRVVFTWGYGDPPDGSGAYLLPPRSSSVEVTLVPDAKGTIVRLIHRGLPEEMQSFHELGWEHYLARLVIVGEGGDPGPDPMAVLLEIEPD